MCVADRRMQISTDDEAWCCSTLPNKTPTSENANPGLMVMLESMLFYKSVQKSARLATHNNCDQIHVPRLLRQP